jgi:hypothetical protein
MTPNSGKKAKKDAGKKQASKKGAEELDYFFVDEKAKQYDFADLVRIIPTPNGMILRFARFDPEVKKFGIYYSVILPYPVVDSLSGILKDRIDELEKKGLLVKSEPEKGGN